MKKLKYKEVSAYELLANLYVALVAGLGGVRGVEWIITDMSNLEKVSPLYLHMERYMDVHIMGWLMLISSVLLIISIFFKGKPVYYLFIIGGIVGALVHFIFAMASVGSANLFTTYYNALMVACCQWILVVLGVVALWKTNNSER